MPKKTRRRTRAPASAPRRSRSNSKSTSVLALAESALIANAVVSASTGLGIMEFATNKGSGGGSFNITAREMIDGLFGGGAGIYAPSATKQGIDATVGGVMTHNLKKNAIPLIAQLVLIPVGFRMGKKWLGKPLINPINKVLRNASIKGVKL